jgi:hypothetical protein
MTLSLIKSYARALLNTAGMCNAYDSWSDGFCRQELKTYAEPCSAGVITLEMLRNIDRNDLLDLGFGLWSEETPNLLLIPIWLVPFMDKNMEVTDIFGEKDKLSNVDLDTRFGCIAYGLEQGGAQPQA